MSVALDYRRVETDSALFEAAVALRDRVLRDPLGRPSARHERARDLGGTHFVAVRDNAVVGCLALYPEGRGAVLRSMAVASEMQGAGVGAALYAYAEEWAIANGVAVIEAEARSGAVGFYIACGFAAEGAEYLGHGVPHRKVCKNLRRA